MRREQLFCDRCKKELIGRSWWDMINVDITIKAIIAWDSTRRELCKECYEKFIQFMEAV